MLNTLKNAPDKTKKIYALVISGSVTLVIAFVWVTIAMPSRMGTDEKRVVAEERSTSPFLVARTHVESFHQDIIRLLHSANDFFTASSFFESKIEYRAE